LKAANAVHCISDFTAARVREYVGPLDTIKVLRWGVRAAEGRPTGPPQFDLITVGRVAARKNLDTVLLALAGLPAVRYAVVGDGPDLPRLRELAASLGLTNVTFFGAVSDQERDALLARSRAFIMCPRGDKREDVEGLGLVYYEAHAYGLPVIGAASGGAPEAIANGGILVRSSQDVGEVQGAIARILKPAEYRRLKQAVTDRQSAASWEGFLVEFEQLYYSQIAQARAARDRPPLTVAPL
jgi:phosphatidylinositol alpha-1,6-mannosyltransferase